MFIDPPFRKGLLNETIRLLEKNQWLANESWIYVESEAESPLTDIPANWQLHREKLRVKWHTVYLFVIQLRKQAMLINAGRVLMICVWGFMVFNLIHPFPKPLKYFMDIAMVFMIFMHALQTIFLKQPSPKAKNSQDGCKHAFFSLVSLRCWQCRKNKNMP